MHASIKPAAPPATRCVRRGVFLPSLFRLIMCEEEGEERRSGLSSMVVTFYMVRLNHFHMLASTRRLIF